MFECTIFDFGVLRLDIRSLSSIRPTYMQVSMPTSDVASTVMSRSDYSPHASTNSASNILRSYEDY